MADVFISYSREDKSKAEHIALGLAAMGVDTFWDTEIPPGQSWADYIEGKLSACKAVIVLWSEHSIKSQWVREEARMGREQAKLIPVILDGAQPPFGFGEVQAADLSNWSGDYGQAEWKRFAQAVNAAVRGAISAAQQPQAAFAPQPQTAGAFQQPPAAITSSGWRGQAAAGAAGGEHSPIAYIQKCFRLYALGTGRARRAEYGWFVLAWAVFATVAVAIDMSLFGISFEGMPNSYLLSWLGLGFLAPGVSAASRRLHDLGLNGWLAAVTVLPYIGWLAALVLVFVPGQPGQNAYGPDPKAA